MKITIKLIAILSMFSAMCSCNTLDVAYTSSQDKYLTLYQSARDSISSSLSSTRSGSISQDAKQPVTEDEIDAINNLETLLNYDKDRLIAIEDSRIYQEKYERGQETISKANATFLETHSLEELHQLQDFVAAYILSGSHNKALLSSALSSTTSDDLKSYLSLSAAVVDAYGEEHVWNDLVRETTTYQDAIKECDRQAIVAVSVILVGVTFNLAVNSVMPWSTFITMASTLESMCSLITIHNLWIECRNKARH